MFITALFIIAPFWKQPDVLQQVSGDNELWYIQITEYYSATKVNHATTYATNHVLAGYQRLTPVILATWEAEIGRMVIRDQPRHKDHKTPFPK
jgi:predicted GNAT family N-acyltransferase